MMPLFATALLITVVGFLAILKTVHSRMQFARNASGKPAPAAARYRPMLRLLTETGIGTADPRAFRARRRAIFRKYLRCLTRDYAQLLAGVRTAMVESGVDRPDLAKALARNRFLFMVAICRIELALAAHAVGVEKIGLGTLDVSGLIHGLDVLRAQLPNFEESFVPAR